MPTNPIQGVKPSTVTVNNISGGTAFFGSNGISAPTAPVTLNLKGSNIVFNTGSRPASAITVNSNVTITADPMNAVATAVSLPTSIPSLAASLDQTPTFIPLAGTSIGQATARVLDGATPSIQAPTPLRPVNLPQQSSGIGDSLAAPAWFNLAQSQTPFAATAGQMSSSPGAFAATTPATRAIDYWMSDTELTTGRIPAILFSDEELGIKSDVSTIVELEEEDQPSALAAPPDRTESSTSAQSSTSAESPTSMSTSKAAATSQSSSSAKRTPLVGIVSRGAAGAKAMRLKRGSVVFAPSSDTVVHTAYGDVRIAAKSIVLMMSFSHGLAVYNLHEVTEKPYP